ncbi:MAG TPA: hypothetical protein VF836_10195, partial [Gemmatimonadaceae bacterium]
MIYDAQKRVIASSDPRGSEDEESDPGPHALVVSGDGDQYYVVNGGTFYRQVQPLVGSVGAGNSSMVGVVSIDMRMAPVDATITRNLFRDIG